MLDKIIKELEIHIKACTDAMDEDCHPNDEDAYLNKIQAFREAIKVVDAYRYPINHSSRLTDQCTFRASCGDFKVGCAKSCLRYRLPPADGG